MDTRISNTKMVACLFVIMLLVFPTTVSAADIKVIVNSSVTETSLDKSYLKKIYLGKKNKWSSAGKIFFVTLSGGPVHEAFLNEYVGKSPLKYNKYWLTKAFSGKGTVPKSFGSEDALMEYVASTKGAIGYIGPSTTPAGVKTVSIK